MRIMYLFLGRQSWLYNFVGLLVSMAGVVNLIKMLLVNFLKVWSYFYTRISHLGKLYSALSLA